MYLLIILIQISFITSNTYINETTFKLKYILNKYKTCRKSRCVQIDSEGKVEKALELLKRTERLGDLLHEHNISDCGVGASGRHDACASHHGPDGLLLHANLSQSHWDEYKSTYNKQYVSETHEESALSAWSRNLARVATHNQLYLAGERSYTLHLNLFGDWSIAGYIEQLLKLIKTLPLFDPARDVHRTGYRRQQQRQIPSQMDWRAEGYRPRIEEQWHCGACYAFAVTHALQAQVYRSHGDWRELSPQQIVDCSYSDGNQGCNGGSLQAALRYAARAGLIRETQYPYLGKKGHCHYNSQVVTARPRRWATLPSGDEAAIERALATIGPLAVAVNAEPFTFQLYRSGIYDDPFCVPWKQNHAMLLIGYTPEYWILLNWWGKQWGEDGYMRIRRGFNVCGVTNMATYVEL